MKKLTMLLGAALIALAACSMESSSPGAVDAGFGSKDAAADVTLGDCVVEFGVVTCDLKITNPTDGTSDYYIEAALENSAGENVGIANALASGIKAGQTARADLMGVPTGNAANVTVIITTVQRTAS